MFHTAILLFPIDIEDDDIGKLLENAANYVESQIFIEIHSIYSNIAYERLLPRLSELTAKIYDQSSSKLPELDVIVRIETIGDQVPPVEVILFGMPRVSTDLKSAYLRHCDNIITIGDDIRQKNLTFSNETVYNTVVLGGTFDRLHAGHKILLTQSVLRARKRVVVGVTDETMIRKGKILPEMILPVQQRIKHVLEFVQNVNNGLTYEVVPISDPFGPTATDPDMDMIVVSDETFRGGQKVNELRAEKGLCQLQIYTIPLVDHSKDALTDTDLNVNEQKVSSSRGRYELLGKFVKSRRKLSPKEDPNIFCVGLVGDTTKMLDVLEAKEQKIGKVNDKSIQNHTGLIFLNIGASIDNELLDKCQEIWGCLSSEAFVSEKMLEIVDVFFTSSIPLEPQVDKTWENLLVRSNC